jgi:cytochrome c
MKILIFVMIMMLSGQIIASPELAQKKGCMNCHAVDRKILGPAFRDIAAKYSGQDLSGIERSIREGGSGRWGQVPMPAQPHVTTAEAQTLARWIFTVK